MNSGLNILLTSSITLPFISSWFCCSVIPDENPSDLGDTIFSAPALLVIIIIVFLKSITLPVESVICPSSSTCKSTLNTSGWAFSTSSKRITEYGFLLTFSLSCPPSSYPTYPGGEPISFDTVCFSINSDISTLIREFSVPNIASASAFESSVFPTPVGPKKRNEPIGLSGSLSPTLPLRIALATAATASSCPITLLCKVSSSFDTTEAISSSSTIRLFLLILSCHCFVIFSSCSFFFNCFFLISPACS